MEQAEEFPIRSREQRVMGGTLSDNDSVVAVFTRRELIGALCSGTLLSPRLVITARHCVSVYTEGEYTCTIDGELDLSRPRSPANAGEIGSILQTEKIEVYLGQTPSLEAAATTSINIALLVLKDALPGTPAKLRLGSGINRNETITVAGYGVNEERRTLRKERSMLSILGVGPSEFFSEKGQAMPRTFVIESSACPGDSGGPAFSDENGEILGVFSLFRGDCESPEARDFYTQIAPYEDLLREGFALSGSPWPEDDMEPVTTGGEGGVTAPDLEPTNTSPPSPSCTLVRSRGDSTTAPAMALLMISCLSLLVRRSRRRRPLLP
jgi:Trypsin